MADHPKKRDGANVAPEHDTIAAKKQKPDGEERGEDYIGEDILDPATADTVQIRFADNPNSDEIFYKFSSFITINGNDEASGSSFSAAETLMVSFDTRSVPGQEVISGAWPVPEWASGGYYSESAWSVGFYSELASSVGGGEEASSMRRAGRCDAGEVSR